MTFFASLIAIVVLMLVHVFNDRLRVLEGTPRSAWLSIAGGISVAYVFVHLLPELHEAGNALEAAVGDVLGFLDRHAYLLALVGFTVFYGLERLADSSRKAQRGIGGPDMTSSGAFRLHATSFAIYNVLIGYLLHERAEESGLRLLVLFAVAMGLHFLVTDVGLREHYRENYNRIARWIFALALFAGWAIALAGEVSEATLAFLLGFLAGGVILNVIKEELPEEHESNFRAFAIGAAAYSILLLVAP